MKFIDAKKYKHLARFPFWILYQTTSNASQLNIGRCVRTANKTAAHKSTLHLHNFIVVQTNPLHGTTACCPTSRRRQADDSYHSQDLVLRLISWFNVDNPVVAS